MPKAPAAARIAVLSTFIALAALFIAIALPSLAQAANRGGLTAYEEEAPEPAPVEPPETTEPAATEEIPVTGEVGRATLYNGRAIAPANAPTAVKQVIAYANKIRLKPYIYGGGHGRWWDQGYDCSGAVSFALHGGRLMASPLASGAMASWGAPGRGRWITIYANAGHAYMVVAGLRFDTAGNESGESGPRWHQSLGAAAGGSFIARHPVGY